MLCWQSQHKIVQCEMFEIPVFHRAQSHVHVHVFKISSLHVFSPGLFALALGNGQMQTNIDMQSAHWQDCADFVQSTCTNYDAKQQMLWLRTHFTD